MLNYVPINLIIALLVSISVIGIGIFIQVKLSRSDNKFLGLILPILSFLLSIIIVLNISVGTMLMESNINYVGMVFIFLVSNIPTIILGGIYLSERNKNAVKKSIEKMKINDL